MLRSYYFSAESDLAYYAISVSEILTSLTDSFIHPSTQPTLIERLSRARHLRLEKKNYSVARFCVKILSIYILSSPIFYPLTSLGGYLLRGISHELFEVPSLPTVNQNIR